MSARWEELMKKIHGDDWKSSANRPKMTREETRALMAKIRIAREALIEHAGHDRSKPVHGQMPCPVCSSGTLHYTVHSNSHVHAKCTTNDCVSWIE